jgi:hypothetical protein
VVYVAGRWRTRERRDVWFRIITSEKHINKGAINHGAFKGRFLGVPDRELNRPWTQEASGRLRSIAGAQDEIKSQAEQYCAKLGTRYAGIMFCPTANARGSFLNISTAVNYTPKRTGKYADEAHADLNFTGTLIEPGTPEEEQMLLYLSDIIIGLHPEQIRLLPEPNFVPEPIFEQEETPWLDRLLDWIKSVFRSNPK